MKWLVVAIGICLLVGITGAGWAGRSGQSVIAMPDGSIILMGG